MDDGRSGMVEGFDTLNDVVKDFTLEFRSCLTFYCNTFFQIFTVNHVNNLIQSLLLLINNHIASTNFVNYIITDRSYKKMLDFWL